MSEAERLTFKAARTRLAEIDYTIRRTGDGELRVAPKGGTEEQREARAYYTTDLADAVGTAKAERSRLVLSEGAWSTALARVSESDTMTGPQPQGRDAEDVRQYPGERLMGRMAGPVRDDEFER